MNEGDLGREEHRKTIRGKTIRGPIHINTTQLSYFFLLGRRRSFLTRKCTSHRVVSRASARDVSMVNMRYYLSTKDACYAPNAKNADPISLRWPHNVVREG